MQNPFTKKTLLIFCCFFTGLFVLAGRALTPHGLPPAMVTTDTIPAEPLTDSTVGFFMDNWKPKTFTGPVATTPQPVTKDSATVTVTVNTAQVLAKIAPDYFGNNSNLWSGQLNSNTILVNHLINYKPKLLRGPGGSLSDVFFFNASDSGKPMADTPDSLVDAKGVVTRAFFWHGQNTKQHTFGIDGYYDLLQKTNSIGLLTVNYGYARYGTGPNPVAAAAHLAANWVRYDKGHTRYWEIGNECFGDWEAGYRIDTTANRDGQPKIITGELYGKHFKVFADSMRKAAAETGVAIKIGAVLYDSDPQPWSGIATKTWNSGYLAAAGNAADFYSVHSYFTPYRQNSSAANILASATHVPQAIKKYVLKCLQNAGLPAKPIAMTEWNLFASGSKQNVSNIAGVHAVIALGELIADRFGAAVRWDLANGWDNGDDHGFFNNGSEPGGKAWNPRPVFYYMYYFQKTTGDRLLASRVTGAGSDSIVSIATSFSGGQKGVVLVNKGTIEKTVAIQFQHFAAPGKFYYYVLNGGTDNGEFSKSVYVNGQGPSGNISGGPDAAYTTIKMYSAISKDMKITVPARGVVYLVADRNK